MYVWVPRGLTILFGSHGDGRGGRPLAPLGLGSEPNIVESVGVEASQGIGLG